MLTPSSNTKFHLEDSSTHKNNKCDYKKMECRIHVRVLSNLEQAQGLETLANTRLADD